MAQPMGFSWGAGEDMNALSQTAKSAASNDSKTQIGGLNVPMYPFESDSIVSRADFFGMPSYAGSAAAMPGGTVAGVPVVFLAAGLLLFVWLKKR
jgi:hypothetical protein